MRLTFLTPLWLTLASPPVALAAPSICPDGEPPTVWLTDADRDGWGITDGNEVVDCQPPGEGTWAPRRQQDDCDDTDPTVFPGATERCDDPPKDNNCDGVANGPDAVDQLTVYRDADGDGAGDPDVATSACFPPEGFVYAPDDCDDSDPAIYPGAPERCNRVDDNCNGIIDESASLDDRAPHWYPDADGDFSGDELADAVLSCQQPEGHVRNNGDCDDDDPTIYANAPEDCTEDAVDRNCDGFVGAVDHDGDGFPACEDCDDGDPDVYPGAPDEPYDGIITDCHSLDDFDADNDFYIAEGHGGDDCDDFNPLINPGAEEIPGDGIDNNCDGSDAPLPGGIQCDGCSGLANPWLHASWTVSLGLVLVLRRRPTS